MTSRTQARRLARPGRRTAAAAALVALGLGLGASPAAAVNPLTTAGELDVVEQTVVTSWVEGVDGAPGTQRMLVDVRAVGRVEAGGQTQVLIVTPTEPTVTPGTPDVLTAVADAASPEEIVQEQWWPDLESFGGGGDEDVASAGAAYPIAERGIYVHGAVPATQLPAGSRRRATTSPRPTSRSSSDMRVRAGRSPRRSSTSRPARSTVAPRRSM
ncbi:hypothetical protein [Salana multivorans]